ncbi:MAG: hypothetical protein J1F64_09340, partial [Oscillospiraceae bacterium]|nr:hypothetical protein [Oscillospiraceae bacterium]
YNLKRIAVKYDTNDTEDKIRFVNEAAKSLASIRDGIEVDAYVKDISDRTDISREAIYSAIKKNIKKEPELFAEKRVNMPAGTADNKRNAVNNKITEAEKLLLSIIYKNKKMSRFAEEKINEKEFSTPLTSNLAEMIYSSRRENKQPDPAVMITHFEGDEAEEAAAIFYNMQFFDDEEIAVKELIKTIKTEQLRKKIEEETDIIKKNELLKEKLRLGEEF